MRLICSLLLVITVFAVSTSFSHATQVYGAGNFGQDGLSTFYKIDPAQTPIGPIGFERCGGMDFHPVTQVLYALCERADGSDTGVLITINMNTGAGTEIGPTGINGEISDISFRNSDNVLFAENVSNDPQHTLYTINIITGQATLVGDTGLGATGGNGMSFNLGDTLFLQTTVGGNIPELYEMNQTNGQAQFLRNVFFPQPNSDQDRFKALDADPESGIMFGIYTVRRDPDLTFLGVLDTSTGQVRTLFPVTNDLDAFALLEFDQFKPIPTLSEWSLIAMAGVLGIISLLALRRRKVAA